MVDLHIDKKENLSGYDNLFSSNKNYNRLMLYADEELKNYVLNCNQIIIERLNNKKDEILLRAKELKNKKTKIRMARHMNYYNQLQDGKIPDN